MFPGMLAASARRSGGITDPNFSSVVLLAGFEASFNDESSRGNNLSQYSGGGSLPVLSTAQAKWGTGSALFAGANSKALTCSNADFAFTTYTIEAWVYPTSFSNYSTFFAICGSGDVRVSFRANQTTGTLNLQQNGTELASTATLSLNTWSHVACTWDGTYARGWLNGTKVLQFSPTAFNGVAMPSAYIGAFYPPSGSSTYPFAGYLDDLRITKNVVRYTADFTAPTAAFPRA